MIGFHLRRRRPTTAAEWFAARRGGSNSRLDRQFQAWLAKDGTHGEEYALCEIIWEVSGDAARQVPEPRPLPRAAAALHWRAAALVAAATAVSLVVWFWPQQTQIWATAPGEQLSLLLEDGSSVTLNTRTRIAVQFTRREREIVLQGGEAYFDVARDGARPFTVRTSLGSAHAVGTRFNVYLADRRLAVTTEEGRVLVANAATNSGVLVEAGRQAELRPGMPQAIVEPADLTAALDWLTRRLEVNDEPLGSVLEDFSRYTTMSIRADTPTIAALRVSAVLHTGDVAALEATLKGAFGLVLERRGSELVVTTPDTDEAMSP